MVVRTQRVIIIRGPGPCSILPKAFKPKGLTKTLGLVMHLPQKKDFGSYDRKKQKTQLGS